MTKKKNKKKNFTLFMCFMVNRCVVAVSYEN